MRRGLLRKSRFSEERMVRTLRETVRVPLSKWEHAQHPRHVAPGFGLT